MVVVVFFTFLLNFFKLLESLLDLFFRKAHVAFQLLDNFFCFSFVPLVKFDVVDDEVNHTKKQENGVGNVAADESS